MRPPHFEHKLATTLGILHHLMNKLRSEVFKRYGST